MAQFPNEEFISTVLTSNYSASGSLGIFVCNKYTINKIFFYDLSSKYHNFANKYYSNKRIGGKFQ